MGPPEGALLLLMTPGLQATGVVSAPLTVLKDDGGDGRAVQPPAAHCVCGGARDQTL